MQRIKFENIQRSWLLITILILSIIFILFGLLELIPFDNPKVNKRILGTGLFLQVLFYTRMLWFRNYVQWNKIGVMIRIKSFFGKTLKFNEIRSSELNNKELVITKHDGKVIPINLNGIDESDARQLKDMLDRQSRAQKVVGR